MDTLKHILIFYLNFCANIVVHLFLRSARNTIGMKKTSE